jgi:hypothetical protein
MPRVAADADRFGEALTNLLDNALRHTPPRGTVTVTAARGTRFGRADRRDGYRGRVRPGRGRAAHPTLPPRGCGPYP